MDFQSWCDAANDALKKAKLSFLLGDVEDAELSAAFQAGVSPTIFIQRCRAGQVRLKPRDAGLGACPQCGSRDLYDREVSSSNETARIVIFVLTGAFSLLFALIAICFIWVPVAVGIVLVLFFQDKKMGTSRTCRKCGHAWKVV